MAIDLDNLTPKQLNDLILKAEQRKNGINAERIEKLREKIRALAKAEGFTVEELFGFGRGTKRGAVQKVKPKYKNPADPSQKWSGRGRQPVWYRDAVAAGKKEKDLLI
jgi:DNA-binding protein H-NS